MPRLFAPTARELKLLVALGLASLTCALYLRYVLIEQMWVALSCQEGTISVMCVSRIATSVLFKYWVFGSVALIAATLNLIRPSLVRFAVATVAAAFGVVLYNIGPAGIAIGMLVLSLARPASGTR
jgi:hypothetical protein